MWPLVGEIISNHTQYKRKREEESEHIKLGGERSICPSEVGEGGRTGKTEPSCCERKALLFPWGKLCSSLNVHYQTVRVNKP